MKDFVKYFLLAFIPFLLYGFYKGTTLRNEVVRDVVYKNIRLAPKNDKFYFRHICEGQETHRFDVDADTFTRSLETGGQLASYELQDAPSERHLEYKELVTAFLSSGTATALLTFKDFEKIASKNKSTISKIVGTFLGGISGYLLGKWLGSHIGVGCDSQLATMLLENEQEWRSIENTYMYFSLLGMKWRGRPLLFGKDARNMNPVGQDPLFELDTPLRTDYQFLKQRGEQASVNFNSEDFACLYRLKKVYNSIADTPDYNRLVQQYQFRTVKRIGRTSPENLAFDQAKWDAAAKRIKATVADLYQSNLYLPD